MLDFTYQDAAATLAAMGVAYQIIRDAIIGRPSVHIVDGDICLTNPPGGAIFVTVVCKDVTRIIREPGDGSYIWKYEEHSNFELSIEDPILSGENKKLRLSEKIKISNADIVTSISRKWFSDRYIVTVSARH